MKPFVLFFSFLIGISSAVAEVPSEGQAVDGEAHLYLQQDFHLKFQKFTNSAELKSVSGGAIHRNGEDGYLLEGQVEQGDVNRDGEGVEGTVRLGNVNGGTFVQAKVNGVKALSENDKGQAHALVEFNGDFTVKGSSPDRFKGEGTGSILFGGLGVGGNLSAGPCDISLRGVASVALYERDYITEEGRAAGTHLIDLDPFLGPHVGMTCGGFEAKLIAMDSRESGRYTDSSVKMTFENGFYLGYGFTDISSQKATHVLSAGRGW